MSTHELKTWPEQFRAVFEGHKLFEFRRDDRGFALGDTLVLREFDAESQGGGSYSGRALEAVVTYITRDPRFGIPDGFCVMSLSTVRRFTYGKPVGG